MMDSYNNFPAIDTKTVPPPQRFRRWIVIFIICIVVIGAGLFRYNSPTITAKGFMDALYSGDTQKALSILCNDSPLAGEIELNASLAKFFNINTSDISYSVSSESLTSASVSVNGGVSDGFNSLQTNGILDLQASGIGWCVDGAEDVGQVAKGDKS